MSYYHDYRNTELILVCMSYYPDYRNTELILVCIVVKPVMADISRLRQMS